jgi:hypothetical protein
MKCDLAAPLRLGVCLLVVCAITLAHHGVASSYDYTKKFTTQATVTDFHYANPHPQLLFDIKDEQSNVAHWTGEIAPSPAQLVQAGWGRKRCEAALAPGAVVTITLSPSRSGMDTHVGVVEKIISSSGELVLGTISFNAGGGETARKK